MAQLSVTPAREADLESLSDLVPRAFHRSNEYFRTTLPNTPLLRQWWAGLIGDAIRDLIYHVLTIIDSNETPGARLAVSLLLLRRIAADGTGENVFHRHPPTADHDHARYAAMLRGSVGGPRERLMSGVSHFSLDLFGVDDQYQGSGLGKALLKTACEIADAQSADIFVQANIYARAFYEKRGFQCVEEILLPGPEKYGEVFLVYRADGTQDDQQ